MSNAPRSNASAGVHDRIADWFAANARDLPWRDPDCSPWGVMVSEFMLQQTPVVRVLPVWQEWMDRWPAPSNLAAAPVADVLRAWGRLGYPRRAVRLHQAAAAIEERHAGLVPDSVDALLDLPGVGSYTAAAIAAFAHGRRTTVVDTNIRRVHARLVSGQALPAASLSAAETRLAQRLLPEDEAASVVWNAAVMELGAVVCTARSPRCGTCPVTDVCAWNKAGRPAAERVPRGQSWTGTDRQVRGAVMAVLRAAHGSVPREALVRTDVVPSLGTKGDETGDVSTDAFVRLHALRAPVEQVERALAGLIADGLAEQHDDGVRLPG